MREITIEYAKLFKALCIDLQIPSPTVEYCLRRINCEGIAFLTVTLPKLGSSLLRAFELRSLAAVKSDLTCFRWKGNALIYFNELLEDSFEKDGQLKQNGDHAFTIYRIRQFTHYFYKLSLEFSESQLAEAERTFIEVEESLASPPVDISFNELCRRNLETFYSFPSKDEVLKASRPRFGPGTFSTRRTTTKCDPYYVEKAKDRNANGYLSRFEGIKGFFKLIPAQKNVLKCHETDSAPYSEVLFVPKDSRGPRVITREPLLALKGQMSFFDFFSRFFERATNRRINFTDQSVNRTLAQRGSITGEWATLDLKEASDRVPYSLVKSWSRFIPCLRYFLKFRTRHAKLPSGSVVSLNKLAGMGSGLTFIWLALVSHTAIATEISQRTGIPFSIASKDVFVYGDDIVVRACHVSYAFSALKKVGLSVNDNKSFYRRAIGTSVCFRESCGGDYFGGSDVAILRFKMQNCKPAIERMAKRITFGNQNSAVVALSSHAGQASLNGLNAVSSYLYSEIQKTCGRLPQSRRITSSITRVTRNYIFYPSDSTGAFVPVKVLCSNPVYIDVTDKISEYWHYANALREKDFSNVSFLTSSSHSTSQFEMAVPRQVGLRYKTVSPIWFVD